MEMEPVSNIDIASSYRGLCTPSFRAQSLSDIPIDVLVNANIWCVLVDRDNTCVPRTSRHAPREVATWLENVRNAGIATCMVSNNFHSAQVETSARELGCTVVHHAMKPAPYAVTKARRLSHTPAENTVLIGDQIFTDIMAGNLAGVHTILVEPQSTTDNWYTRLFRQAERLVTSRMRKNPPPLLSHAPLSQDGSTNDHHTYTSSSPASTSHFTS